MTDFRVLDRAAATDRGVLEAPFLDTADCRGAMSDSRVRYHAPRPAGGILDTFRSRTRPNVAPE